jgi:hypothetical protein
MDSSSSHQHEDIFFNEVIQERIEDDPLFVERKWLVSRIEHVLNDPSCRFVLVTGEPGIGKTTMMAELARHYPDSLRYFLRVDNRTPYRSGSAQSFLMSIGLQLALRRRELFRSEILDGVVRQRVATIQSGGTVIGIKAKDWIISPFYQATLTIDQKADNVAGTLIGIDVGRMVINRRLIDPDNLQFLALFDPARALWQTEPTARILILVDALDELHNNSKQESIVDWLASCPELPPNVRFVLTSRDDPVLVSFKQRQSQWLKLEKISLSSEGVQRDLHSYTSKFVDQDAMIDVLAEHKLNADIFIERAAAKAQGNFLYLHTLFRAIQDTRDPQRQELLLRLEDVPAGLEELYRFFLEWIKHDVRGKKAVFLDEDTLKSSRRPFWTDLIQPLLGVLAVAGEPLSVEQIMQFGRIQVQDRWLPEALGHVRQFLSVVDDRYFLYHSTFSEYITSPKTRATHGEYYIGSKEWHCNIVRHYGGNRWPWQGVDWNGLDDYGLRHLSTHMVGASLYQELYTLVTYGEERNRWADRHAEKEGSYAGYLHDLDLVWNWVVGQKSWHLGRQFRCVLIRSSIHSLSANIIPELLPALIQQRRLTPLIAFANIEHIPDARQRAKALRVIVPLLPWELLRSALQEAEAIFNDLRVDEQERLNTLCSVMQRLSPEQRTRPIRHLWSKLQAIPDEGYLAAKIVDLWNLLPADLQAEALVRVQKMVKQFHLARALTGIAHSCPPEQRGQMLALIQTIGDERIRLATQAHVVAYLRRNEKESILKQALVMSDEYTCLAILRYLLPGLTGEQKNLAANKAWAVLQRIGDKNQAATALADFAAYFSNEQRYAAVEFIREMPLSSLLKARTLFKLAECLPTPTEQRNSEKEQVRQLIQSVIDSLDSKDSQISNHLSALIKRFPYLTDEQKLQVIDLAQHIPGRYQRVWVLLEVVELGFLQCLPGYLQESLITTIERLTQVIDDYGERATIMAVLANYAAGSTGIEALHEARRIVEQQPEEQPLERSNKALAWLGLVPYLPPEQQFAAINQAIALLQPATPKEIAHRLLHFLPNNVLYQLVPDFPDSISIHLRALLEGGSHWKQLKERANDHADHLLNEQKTVYLCTALATIRDRGNEKLAHGIIEAISSWYKTDFFTEEHRKLWIETLHACAHRDRKACMNDLIALTPLLLYLSDDQEQDEAELLRALRDSERWWH